jgi:hypothetical protein
MTRHPEQAKDEVFVGNTSSTRGIPLHLRELTTIRMGEVAYDIHGLELSPDYMRPLFVHDSEAEQYEAVQLQRRRTS